MDQLRKSAMRVMEAWDETVLEKSRDGMMQERMEALRAALAEPEQDINVAYGDGYHAGLMAGRVKGWDAALEEMAEREPIEITITGKVGNIYSFRGDYRIKKGDKLYVTPQPAKREPLTEEEIEDLARGKDGHIDFARAIERAHGIGEKV